ncbi:MULTISPECIES: CidA/LrgA family protein [unclassified Nocardioides]|uniref:CidA/LrgA family protein n=1 Tax=unclassified Nocardioides TaxID=2615069 RepID=UPI0006FB4660|nr:MULTISPECIES: CidA/LrgA family protein [unclassified Nocardioides]KRA30865.1 LrgA family protein [Nocardioides sp. Root614]KRA87485.1 LrgA family protein [Nocardioides sp. Root682]
MIAGLTWLVAFQLAGELVTRVADLPVPGPVVGMLLLFCFLRLRRYDDAGSIVRAGTALLRHLQLFFVPAGVGVVLYLGLIGREALPIGVAMLGSWFLGLAAVGWTAVALERLLGRPRDDLGTA